ncbi:MAG: 30S ribosomal protein S1 [Verrucomicrobia bacterium RIFCSPHIGHO2_12_FULL_41_10]|nr:MAG: 30S ribosomal protein S1 [Verrucomicrobia bacterium RIFCSPHIGHO2_12_FULL_41_10]HLB34880.1 30S ribosomal protein S1 [Chthoniobacterales bacterium]
MTNSKSKADLQQLIANSVKNYREGSIVKGYILEKRPKEFLVDIGYKSEGIISASEFDDPDDIHIGDEVEVLLERLENDQGMVILSKQKAAQRQNWDKICKLFEAEGIIKGKVKSVVKGGLTVNVGVEAFLPASQVDITPPKDLHQFVGNTYDFKIVKLNEDRKNVVLSRRELIEAQRSSRRQEFLSTAKAGDIVEGSVKNITDFGAFIDLDGIDGLLHITDMSWARLSHPSEALKPGDRLKVVILEINKEKERISLGSKQLQDNPWDKIEERFPTGKKVTGKITNLMPYGAFVQIEEGIEGLIHVSELSWTKRIVRPSDVLTLGQDIEAVVLGVNKEDQKISLGVRQLEPNPWDEIEQRFMIGKQVKGKVRNMTAYGAFVELEEGIDGMIHVSDLRWNRKINHPSEILKKNDEIEAVVLDIDKANQRISLGVKQLEADPWKEIDSRYKIGDLVKGKVSKITNFGAFIELDGEIDGLVHISQISENRIEKVKDVLKVGEEVEARVIKIDKIERRLGLSIKATNYSEEALKKETEAFDSLRGTDDMVSFGAALQAAEDEYRPGEVKNS